MKNIFQALFLGFILVSTMMSCGDCANIACTTPPDPLAFVIESATEVDPESVKIVNNLTTTAVRIEKEDSIYRIPLIGWEVGKINKSYTLTVNDKTYDFIYLTEAETVECCSLLGELKEFSSEDFEIEKEGGKGYYLFKLP